MKAYSFHPAAESEALEAAQYYELRVRGLARAFRLELEKAIQFVVRHPEAAPIEIGNLRRKPMHRFPYTLLYAIEDGDIRIYAVMHQSRRPGYWASRLRPES